MQVDAEGAVRVARLAKEFEWTGDIDDLRRFGEVAGWEVTWSGDNGITFLTNLDVMRPEARTFMRKRTFSDISLYVTDIVDRSVPWVQCRQLVVDSFVDLGGALEAVLGVPTRKDPGVQAAIGWDYLGVSINLRSSTRSIALELANPKC
ncbi:DUF6301 family protein [Nocardia sp. FBN12]|uniref:DUF6301 family protein n=1 Tax=Nocardia sp. FBN12 TaxID=3419766 RepID=UPI003CFE05C4